jgi:hypothetical protein
MRLFIAIALCFLFTTVHAQRDIAPTKEFSVTGDIKTERTFTVTDIAKYKQVDLGDISIKNHKGEEKSVSHHVKGVLIKNLLDSVALNIDKPKELSEYILVFTASDGYKNVYSWNEIFNTEVGNKLYILTERDGNSLADMEGRIPLLSMADKNMGSRYLKGLTRIEIKKIN